MAEGEILNLKRVDIFKKEDRPVQKKLMDTLPNNISHLIQ